MKDCPKCRSQIDDRATRCPNCAAVIGVDPARILMIVIITVAVFLLFGGVLIKAFGGT